MSADRCRSHGTWAVRFPPLEVATLLPSRDGDEHRGRTTNPVTRRITGDLHDGRVGRVLNAAPLVFVGWLSYSLYLWQQPFLNRPSASPLAAFPLNILIVTALAVGSYFIVERPSLVFSKRIERNWGRRRAQSVDATPKAERALELDSVVMRGSNTVAPAK